MKTDEVLWANGPRHESLVKHNLFLWVKFWSLALSAVFCCVKRDTPKHVTCHRINPLMVFGSQFSCLDIRKGSNETSGRWFFYRWITKVWTKRRLYDHMHKIRSRIVGWDPRGHGGRFWANRKTLQTSSRGICFHKKDNQKKRTLVHDFFRGGQLADWNAMKKWVKLM